MSPKLRKAIGIIKYFFLLLVILFLLLVGAVNLPVVHKALTKKANTILLEKGIPLHIGKVTLLLNGKIGVNELAMIVPPNDTIIYIDKLRVDFSLMPLFSNRIFINEIILNEAVINMVSDSITNQLQIISALNPTGKESEKPQADSTKTASSWDIDVRTIRLKNIRFLYNDANGGILVKEKLDEAKIDFEKFSLTNRQIDIKSIEIDKPVGMVAIWEGKEKPAEEITESSPWLIKAKNLEINDLIFTLEQPDIGQQIDVALKNGNISLQKLDLEKEEILVNSIELKEPEVTFFNENKVQSEPTKTNFSETISIPMSPWTIISDELKIIDGNLNYVTSNGSENASLEKWLPVSKLNTTFGKILLSPGGYNLNLEKTSFNLDTTLQIESGSINFELDSLQNTALNIKLSALLNNKKGWFIKKQYLNFNANIDGNQSALQIRELGILSTTGLKFNVTGNVQQPLKMENSVCDLRFASGSVSRNLLAPLIHFLSPKTVLPKFRPFMISGEIKNSLLNPVFNLNIRSQSGNIKTSGRYNLKNSSGKLQAAFSNILLSELFEDTYPEHITGTINLNGSFSSGKMPEGEAAIKIDSVRYKNKTTKNIFVEAESHNAETKFIVQAADNSLNVDLKAFVNYNNTTDFSGTLEGFFEADLFELNLIDEPYAGNGNIISSFSYSPYNLTASLGLNDINISNKNSDANIEKIQFKLNKNDSIIESDIEADFLVAKFFSRASLNDFENAWDSTSLTTAISIDSTNFINLKAITNLEHFSLDAKVKHNSFFNLFYPDSVLNFSDIVIQVGKNKTDSLVLAKVSTDWLSYNDFKIFKPNILANVAQNQLILKIDNDSTVKDQLKFGKMGVDINVLPSSIKSKFILVNKADSLMHMISIEAQQKDERVIFKSGTPNWIINKKPFDLMPIEFLTWDKTEKYFIANLGLHSEEKHIELVGNSSDTVELNLKNFELNNPLIHGIIGFSPQGFIQANIKYNGKKNDELDFNIEMHKMGLDSIYLDLITVDGHLIADSTGIIESELVVLADDSLSLYAEMLTNNQKDEFLVKSKFNKLQFNLLGPLLNDIASNLHGTSSGEIIISNQKENFAIDGEIRFNDFGLKVIPLQTWLKIPDNKVEIKKNEILFNNFTVLDSLKRPLSVNGKINLVSADDITVDLKVKADKIQIMNTPESKDVPLFGSVIINSGLTIDGSIYSPKIKGNIELVNGTNLTYQLIQDLSVKGSQTDVLFAEITDDIEVIYPKSMQLKKPTSMPNIDATVRIDPKSIFNLKINDLYNIDITITGNGLLNYNMLPNNSMSLNGNYEIQSGDCNLKITGWPLKKFNITSGSSFSWNGKVENPTMNLEATTKVRGSYLNPIDNNSRVVDFIVSMQLKNQLSNLSIVFDIKSPDQYITSILSSLSADDMMRQAVNLLLFETIEIPGIESSGNYLTSQINGFWESQLNSITKANMNKTKLRFGFDTYNPTTASGGREEKTSLTYEMERKFMNDRATVKVSGRLNDYQEGTYQTSSLINNFIIEYALDSLNTKNIKLYQKRDYEDMLEGEVTKYGIGFLYRKSYKKLKDIWQRKKKGKTENKNNNNN